MRKNLPSKATAQRIENRSGTGMPDVLITWDGLDLWVELKVLKKHPETLQTLQTPDWLYPVDDLDLSDVDAEKLQLRPSQKAFAVKRIACGGISFVLANDRGPRSKKSVYLLTLTEDRSLAALRLCLCDDWEKVFEVLRLCGSAALRRCLENVRKVQV